MGSSDVFSGGFQCLVWIPGLALSSHGMASRFGSEGFRSPLCFRVSGSGFRSRLLGKFAEAESAWAENFSKTRRIHKSMGT